MLVACRTIAAHLDVELPLTLGMRLVEYFDAVLEQATQLGASREGED
jgi:hypothetical protein